VASASRWRAAAFLAAVLAILAPVAAVGAPPKRLNACALITASELRHVLGSPVDRRRGATIANCAFRAGQFQPVVAVAAAGGTRSYRNLVRAVGAPVKRLAGVGTEAVTYDHSYEDPTGHARGVIVRKGTRVIHLSTTGIGLEPVGLANVSQLVALARIATRRL
jgi:hypothetical protein